MLIELNKQVIYSINVKHFGMITSHQITRIKVTQKIADESVYLFGMNGQNYSSGKTFSLDKFCYLCLICDFLPTF